MMAFDYFIFFQAIEVSRFLSCSTFFPVLQNTLQDCEEQHHYGLGLGSEVEIA
jgi:hypothetical protein